MDSTKLRDVEDILTQMVSLCEPVSYKDFNIIVKAKDVNVLREFESSKPIVGIARYDTPEEGISTLSIIATITDILTGKRLAAIVDNGIITGFKFVSTDT